MNILTIVFILILLGALGCLIKWIRDNLVPILIVAAIILGLIFFRKTTFIALGIALGGFILYVIFIYLSAIFQGVLRYMANRKEKGLAEKEQKREKKRQDAANRKLKREEEEIIAVLPSEYKEFIKLSQECISELEKEKAEISNMEMVGKVAECQDMIRGICEEVKQLPEVMIKLSKLKTYYYPTILKLVKKYAVYEHRDIDDNNVKGEIISTMSEINSALKVLRVNIISADDIDVLTDISVMKQMIDRDGLR